VFLEHVDSARLTLIKNRSQLIEGHVKRMGLIDESLGEGKIDASISEERRKFLQEVESAYPIPAVRQLAYISVRQRLRERSKRPKTFRGTLKRIDEEKVAQEEKKNDERSDLEQNADEEWVPGKVNRSDLEVVTVGQGADEEEEQMNIDDGDERQWGDDGNVVSIGGDEA
jgi:hypothetical protein